MSLIERAAERLLAEGRVNDGVPTATEHPHAAIESTPSAAAHDRIGKTVEISIEHLVARGCLTSAGSNTPLAMEFRRAKRPLIANVKAEVQAHGHPNGQNLVLVTSSLPDEGKSFVAVNIALSIASEIDQTVLLIDADFARRGAALTLGITEVDGLLDVAAGERSVEEVLLHTSIPSLTYIPAGANRENADELYASNAMRELIAEIGTRYSDRIIIVDAPPVLATNVPRILVTMMGQVLFVVEADRTPQHLVIEGLQQLDGHERIGLLLNKGSRRVPGHSYTYGYGYGYERT